MTDRTPESTDAAKPKFFVCAHQAANSPCERGCHGVPFPEPVADDWYKAYSPPAPQGITDATNVPDTTDDPTRDLLEPDGE